MLLLALFLCTPVLATLGAILATWWALCHAPQAQATHVAYASWDDVLEGLDEEDTLDVGLKALEEWIAVLPTRTGLNLTMVLPSYKVGRALC